MEKIPPIVKTYKFPKTWILEKRKELTAFIPDVRFAKVNNLLQNKHGITLEMIKHNMELCGFDVVSFGEHKSNQTKIITNCCNPDCNGTIEKQYKSYIIDESAPLCKPCATIIRSINVYKKRPIVAIKDSEEIKFESVAEAGRQLDIPQEIVYNHAKSGTSHKSGYWFEFLD
ncbi:hypothetical protein P4646_20000 [Peribacillus simplex]|uniref:hypothetical protein n=1 Tax=Peribacillus simplex TaxID=1478 RepID=UPI002E1E5947|nr:hypothetical protein [Peribacillus simplex]MED4096811.1 hypothetical protein [Peribacillus simplex]